MPSSIARLGGGSVLQVEAELVRAGGGSACTSYRLSQPRGGERAVYVSRMVLQIPVWLVKSVSATETNSCSGYRLVGWMI